MPLIPAVAPELDKTDDGRLVFTHRSPVWFDELDMLGVLHNARYAVHVEHALFAWYHANGFAFSLDPRVNPDARHVVRGFRIDFLAPFRSAGTLLVRLDVRRLGTTSCTHGFECVSRTDDGAEIVHATGERVVVKIDAATGRPAPWSDRFYQAHAPLLVPGV
jgi:acyl-CoA thioester hydrolase